MQLVAECGAKHIEALETPIDCFMPCSCNLVSSIHLLCTTHIWGNEFHLVTSMVPISAIGMDKLIWLELVSKSLSKDDLIWPCSSREWAVWPTDITILDAGSNFPSNARAICLMREPGFVKVAWLMDGAVGPIYHHGYGPRPMLITAVV